MSIPTANDIRKYLRGYCVDLESTEVLPGDTLTSSAIAISEDITDIMVLCNTGDFALSAENTILSAEPYYVDVFTSEMSSQSSWHLSALNSHPTDDIQIDVTVTCIQSTPEEFSKATQGS